MDLRFSDTDIEGFIAGKNSACTSILEGNSQAFFSLYR
jgi:hypothetical protein